MDLARRGVIKISDKCNEIQSDACSINKIHKYPHYTRSTIYSEPLQLVFADVWGPAPTSSIERYKYYLNFVDAYTNFNWLYLLRSKAEVYECFLKFRVMAEKQCGYSLKALQTDNAKEFLRLTEVLNKAGSLHRLCCPHTHPQMGKVERRHRHIVDTGLTLMKKANIPNEYWDYAFMAAIYLYKL